MAPTDDRETVTELDRRAAVRRGYDELADAYDDARALDDVERESVDALLSALGSDASGSDDPDDAGRSLLDAGCGAGRAVLERVADETGIDAVGLDFSREQVERARAFAPTVQGDMTALPFAEGAFDAVTAFHSTIHVPTDDHGTLYEEFARVLRSGGWLLVTVGDDAWTGTNPDWLDAGAAMHWSVPAMETTREHLAAAGFTVERDWRSDDEIGGGEWPVLLCRAVDR